MDNGKAIADFNRLASSSGLAEAIWKRSEYRTAYLRKWGKAVADSESAGVSNDHDLRAEPSGRIQALGENHKSNQDFRGKSSHRRQGFIGSHVVEASCRGEP